MRPAVSWPEKEKGIESASDDGGVMSTLNSILFFSITRPAELEKEMTSTAA